MIRKHLDGERLCEEKEEMRESRFLPHGKGVAEYPKMSFTCALKFSP